MTYPITTNVEGYRRLQPIKTGSKKAIVKTNGNCPIVINWYKMVGKVKRYNHNPMRMKYSNETSPEWLLDTLQKMNLDKVFYIANCA